MENAVSIYQNQEDRPLTVPEIRTQINLIQDMMKSVMKKDEHYGVIPGCGDKPSLLKPGAEKIIFTFRLVPDPEVEVTDLNHPTIAGHREYRVKVKLFNQHGRYLGAGVGSCNTMESKYRFRGGEKISTGQPVPKEYWNLVKAEGKTDEAKALIGGDGFGVGKIDGRWEICEIGEKQEYDNPADYYNTCEKIAKKRALVDGTLTVTAASDIFTQDIEDMADNGVAPVKQTQTQKPPMEQPKAKESGNGKTLTIKDKLILELAQFRPDPIQRAALLKELTLFKKDNDKDAWVELKNISKISDKWAEAALGKLRNRVEEEKAKAQKPTFTPPANCPKAPQECDHSLFGEGGEVFCKDEKTQCAFIPAGGADVPL